jgi:hypothetical protein
VTVERLNDRRRWIAPIQDIGFGDPIMTRHGAGLVGIDVTL